jgi:hypothetical protein
MTFSPGVKKNAIRYMTCARRKHTSPGINEKSSTISPAQEKNSPASINALSLLKVFRKFNMKMIIRTGMIKPLIISPVRNEE